MSAKSHGLTYEQIALLLNVSPVRVRQIEQRAFEKIRSELKIRYGITAADIRAITAPESDTPENWA
jgi:DNA-directed RNA polymerase sigma subunit (sigma70/sigma32)